MASTLKHPATSPTTTITFDGIVDFSHGRQAMNSKDFGGTAGTSSLAASNRTQADLQVTVKLVTDATKSARQKYKELADLVKAKVEDDMELYLDFGSSTNLTVVGKVVSLNATFTGGTAQSSVVLTIDMNIATEVWS